MLKDEIRCSLSLLQQMMDDGIEYIFGTCSGQHRGHSAEYQCMEAQGEVVIFVVYFGLLYLVIG
jgi:hypothetical protein